MGSDLSLSVTRRVEIVSAQLFNIKFIAQDYELFELLHIEYE